MSSERLYDALVIGGGLAGAAVGHHLATHGYAVALVEREEKAHHKICGEFLTPETLPYLKEIGIDLDSLKASTLDAFSFHSSYFTSRSPFKSPARGVSRNALDEACLKSAEKAGCAVFRGHPVEGYEREASGEFVLTTPAVRLRGKALFLANGKHELRKMQKREGRENTAIGFKMHLNLSDASRKKLGQDIALFFFKGGYGGICKIEGDICNLCFIIDKNRYHDLGNSYETVLQGLKEENKNLGKTLKGAAPLWARPLAMAGVPYGYLFKASPLTDHDIYPLGDQFTVIPSLTGSGMAIALFTARLAFRHFHESGKNASSYAQECFKVLKPRMRLAYPLHALTRFPVLANAATAVLKQLPSLAQRLLRGTRIPPLGE